MPKLVMTSMLALALLLTACDRSKPGNPMPPQKPPMPKTEEDKPKIKSVWNGPTPRARANNA